MNLENHKLGDSPGENSGVNYEALGGGRNHRVVETGSLNDEGNLHEPNPTEVWPELQGLSPEEMVQVFIDNSDKGPWNDQFEKYTRRKGYVEAGPSAQRTDTTTKTIDAAGYINQPEKIPLDLMQVLEESLPGCEREHPNFILRPEETFRIVQDNNKYAKVNFRPEHYSQLEERHMARLEKYKKYFTAILNFLLIAIEDEPDFMNKLKHVQKLARTIESDFRNLVVSDAYLTIAIFEILTKSKIYFRQGELKPSKKLINLLKEQLELIKPQEVEEDFLDIPGIVGNTRKASKDIF